MSERECGFAHDDAAYVLGALGAEERLEFERHLAGCPACTRSVGDLAGMPGLLARVPLASVGAAPASDEAPAGLLPALLSEVRRRERTRRWATGLVAAAAVVVALVATGLVVLGGGADAPSRGSVETAAAEAREMTPLGGRTDRAAVALTSVAWGTRLDLTCRWAGPDAAHPYRDGVATYALVVRSRAGVEEQVATWHGLPGRTTRVTGSTSLPAGEIAAVEIRTAGGAPAFRLAG